MKAGIILTLFLTLILGVTSCKVLPKNNTLNYLEIPCGEKTLSEVISMGRSYLAIARENKIEGLVNYKIVPDEVYKVEILNADFYQDNKILDLKADHDLIGWFSNSIEREINENCKPIKDASFEIRVAYKIADSDFHPNEDSYDVLIERVVNIIEIDDQSSH